MKIDKTLTRSQIQREPLAAGSQAPDFSLLTHEGKGVSLKDYRGQRVLLVFSKPDCWPCQQLAPKLEEGQKKNKRNITIVMISQDKDGVETSKKVAEHGLTFPVLIQRHWAQAFAKYGCYGTPTGFLIDGDGVITGVGNNGKEILALLGFSFERRRVLQASAAVLAGLSVVHRLPSGVSLVQAQDSGTCPNRVLRPDYACQSNGQCGSEGGQRFPPSYGAARFIDCCIGHDIDWCADCGDHVWNQSNDKFANCLIAKCDAAYGQMRSWPSPNPLEGCYVAAGLYEAGVRNFGMEAFIAAQREACLCVDGGGGGGGGNDPWWAIPPPGCSDPVPRCVAAIAHGNCFCAFSVEGFPMLMTNRRCDERSRITGCGGSGSCPPGWYCMESCCNNDKSGRAGGGTVCAQPCGSSGELIFGDDGVSEETDTGPGWWLE